MGSLQFLCFGIWNELLLGAALSTDALFMICFGKGEAEAHDLPLRGPLGFCSPSPFKWIPIQRVGLGSLCGLGRRTRLLPGLF